MMQGKHNRELIQAADKGDLTRVEKLLNEGADVNIKNKNGDTALMWAAYKKHKKIVLKLLDQPDIDLTTKCKRDLTALIYAVIPDNKHSSPTILNAILNKLESQLAQDNLKNYVNHTTKLGNSALIIAAAYGDKGAKGCVDILLDKGADVNIKNKKGVTALMWAAYKKHKEIVLELLDQPGIDLTTKCKRGQTAIIHAVIFDIKHSSPTILNAILNKIESQLAQDKLVCESQLAQDNLKNYVNQTTELGNSALTIAADNGAKGCVDILLEKGADVNIANEGGETALMVAASKGNKAVVQKLLQHSGTELTKKCIEGRTAIDHAIKKCKFTIALSILELAIQKAVEKNPSARSEGKRGETKDNDTANTNDAPSPFDCLSEASRNTLLPYFFDDDHPELNFIPDEFKDPCFVYLLKNPNQIGLIEGFHQFLNETDKPAPSRSVSTETKDGAYNPDLNTILTKLFSYQSEFFSISKKSKDACFINLLKNLEHITLIIKVHGLSNQVLKDILIDMQMYLLLSEPDTTDPIKKDKYQFIKSLLEKVVRHSSMLVGTMDIEKITANMFRDSMQKEGVYKISYFFSIFRRRCKVEKLVDRLKEFFSNTNKEELNPQHGINQKSLNRN